MLGGGCGDSQSELARLTVRLAKDVSLAELSYRGLRKRLRLSLSKCSPAYQMSSLFTGTHRNKEQNICCTQKEVPHMICDDCQPCVTV